MELTIKKHCKISFWVVIISSQKQCFCMKVWGGCQRGFLFLWSTKGFALIEMKRFFYSSWACLTTTVLRHFLAFVIPLAGAPRRQLASVLILFSFFFLFYCGPKWNPIIFCEPPRLAQSRSKGIHVESQVFSSPLCFLIFSLYFSFSHAVHICRQWGCVQQPCLSWFPSIWSVAAVEFEKRWNDSFFCIWTFLQITFICTYLTVLHQSLHM